MSIISQLSFFLPQGPPGGGGPPGTPIMPSPGGASPNYVPSTNTCALEIEVSPIFPFI